MSREAMIDRYCDAWCAEEAEDRAALLAGVWAADGTYTDPSVHAGDAAALLAHIAMVRASRPGARVERCGPVEDHNDVARFDWRATLPDGRVVKRGIDIVIFAPSGGIARVIGFFDPLDRKP